MPVTTRDQIWQVATDLRGAVEDAERRDTLGLSDRYGTPGFTVGDVREQADTELTARTVRDCLNAMADLGELAKRDTRPSRYRAPTSSDDRDHAGRAGWIEADDSEDSDQEDDTQQADGSCGKPTCVHDAPEGREFCLRCAPRQSTDDDSEDSDQEDVEDVEDVGADQRGGISVEADVSEDASSDAESERVDWDGLDLPGSGGTLEQRQDAVRELYEYLQDEGRGTASKMQDLVWAKTGYASERSAWKNCLYPGLKQVAEQDAQLQPPSEGGHTWLYTDD